MKLNYYQNRGWQATKGPDDKKKKAADKKKQEDNDAVAKKDKEGPKEERVSYNILKNAD